MPAAADIVERGLQAVAKDYKILKEDGDRAKEEVHAAPDGACEGGGEAEEA
jgi:hypothetical protein